MGFQRNLFLLLIAVLLIAATPDSTLTQSRTGSPAPTGTARSTGRLADAVSIADVIWNGQVNVTVTGNTLKTAVAAAVLMRARFRSNPLHQVTG